MDRFVPYTYGQLTDQLTEKLKKIDEQATLLARGLVQMKAINGPAVKCVIPNECPNHQWIREVETLLAAESKGEK